MPEPVTTQVNASSSTGLRSQMLAELPSLPPAQQRLADYLLRNLATASDLTITDLADEADVSTGTISQLCRRLGLRGYQDLRLGWARAAVSAPASARGDMVAVGSVTEPSLGSTGDAVRRIFTANVEALVETARHLDTAAVDLAVAKLASARRVEWIGSGTAALVAAEGALKLRKLGIDAIAHADGHQQVMSASLLTADDVLVAVSHSGRTTDVLRCVELARSGGTQIIAITGAVRSPLERVAHVVLGTVSHDTGFQVEPMASTVVELSVIQLLFLLLLEHGGEKAQESLARTQESVEMLYLTGRYR